MINKDRSAMKRFKEYIDLNETVCRNLKSLDIKLKDLAWDTYGAISKLNYFEFVASPQEFIQAAIANEEAFSVTISVSDTHRSNFILCFYWDSYVIYSSCKSLRNRNESYDGSDNREIISNIINTPPFNLLN